MVPPTPVIDLHQNRKASSVANITVYAILLAGGASRRLGGHPQRAFLSPVGHFARRTAVDKSPAAWSIFSRHSHVIHTPLLGPGVDGAQLLVGDASKLLLPGLPLDLEVGEPRHGTVSDRRSGAVDDVH